MTHARRAALALLASVAMLLGSATTVQALDAPDPAPSQTDTPAPDRGDSGQPTIDLTPGRIADQPEQPLESAITGLITGRLLVTDGITTAPPDIAAIRMWRWVEQHQFWSPGLWIEPALDESGAFTLPVTTASDYRFEARALLNGVPAKLYWPDTELFADAARYTLLDGEAFALPDATAEAYWPAFGRIAGVNRYETSALLSKQVIDDGERAPVVYLVNGEGFADALSAGPAAASREGVLLLTESNRIPDPIKRELDRIRPHEIVIVGGTGAVSSAVATAARAYVDDPADIRRLAGADRYATSRAVVRDALTSALSGTSIWVATGRSFPDALAAGPAAARQGAQVLLVDGETSRISNSAMSVIRSKNPWIVFIAGGTGAVSGGIARTIEVDLDQLGYGPQVTRLGGPDRYSTAEVINEWVFDYAGADVAFIATGTGFADALAGSTTAAAFNAPIYLSRPSCLSESTYIELLNLWTRSVYAIGGTSVLRDRVLYGDLC
jgi:putative cell wall-binding protein